MSSKTAFIILWSIVAISILINLPFAWWYEWHINDNGTVAMFISDAKFISDSKFYLYYFYEVVKFIMPMLILIVTSILIVKKVTI